MTVFPGLSPGAVWDMAYEEYVLLSSAADNRRQAAQQSARQRKRGRR